MRIAVHGRAFKEDMKPFVLILFSSFKKLNIEIKVSSYFFNVLKMNQMSLDVETFEPHDKLEGIDFFISVGGDGTLLESVTYVKDNNLPILGINIGRLGFLSTTTGNEIENALKSLVAGDYNIDQRALLMVESDQDYFEGVNFALNELSLFKRDTSSMITIHTYIDNQFLNSYWADGLIIATPTGSTGYSMSCGGPIVAPHSDNFIITPVSAHNLSVRPIIVSDESVLSFEMESRGKKCLVSLDSRSVSVDIKTKFTIKKAPFKIKLIELEGVTYYNTLRNKLNWGLDIRN